MAVNSVSNYGSSYQSQTAQNKSAQKENSSGSNGVYSPNEQYKPDLEKVEAMKAELAKRMDSLRQMTGQLIHTQGKHASKAAGQLGKTIEAMANIDKETQLWAQNAISEDGEWGVNKVAENILSFAKALSGGDPSKIEELKEAFIKGFKQAEKIWGGKLPDISYQTYDKVMEGFEEWANPSKTEETAEASA